MVVGDRIEKTIVLKAPRSRVWRAIADSQQFGAWFLVKFDAPFVAGKSLRGAHQCKPDTGHRLVITATRRLD